MGAFNVLIIHNSYSNTINSNKFSSGERTDFFEEEEHIQIHFLTSVRQKLNGTTTICGSIGHRAV